MRINTSRILLTTTAIALGGCTTSLQTRLDDVKPTQSIDSSGKAAGQNVALKGIPYALPMRQYDIEVKRRLSTCSTPIVIDDQPSEYLLPTLAFELSATSTGSLIEGERYLIDYEALSQPPKITDFKIDYHEGTMLLKTVNATADDQTGEIISKTVGAALTLAGLVLPAVPAIGTAKLVLGLATSGKKAVPSPEKKTYTKTTAENALLKILAHSSARIAAIDCVTESAIAITRRDKASAEIKRLSTGKVAAEWQALDIRTPQGRPVPAPLSAGATLADITEKLSVLLPYIGIKPQPLVIREDLPLLLAWQAQVMAAIRAETAVRDKIDKDIGTKASQKWPKIPTDRAIANVSQTGTTAFSKLVETKSALVVDPPLLAKNLAAAQTDLPGLRAKFPEFIGGFLTADNSPRADIKPLSVACYSAAADEETCLAGLLGVSAVLTADTSRDGTTPANVLAVDKYPLRADGRPPHGKMRNKKLFETVTVESLSSSDGLFIRPPIEGTLKICRSVKANECETELLNKPVAELMPQLGQLRFLPFVNKQFTNNGLAVVLAKDGRLVSFGYTSKRATAAAMAASASDVATQLRAFKDAQAKRQTDANAAKIAELKYQIDLFEQTKKVADLDKPAPAQSAEEKQAVIDTQQAAYANAELVRLITEQCLLRAKAFPDMPTACPVD